MTEYTQTAELHNYRLIDLGESSMLVGQIFNDKTNRFDDGETVRTSSIKELNEKEGYAITRNTYYKLVKSSSGAL